MIAVFSVLLFPAVFAERECVIASLDDTMPVTHSFECSRLYHSVVALAAASLSEHRTTCNAFAATACAQLDTCRLINTCNDTSCTFDESLIRLAANPRCPPLPRHASMASLAVCAPKRRGYGDLCVGQPSDACVDVTFDSRTAHSTVVPPAPSSSSAFGRTVSRGPLRNVLQWRGPAYVFPERNVDAAPQRWSAWLADINVVVDSQLDAAVGVAFAVNQSITQQHYAAVWRGDVVELLSIDSAAVRVLANSTAAGGVPLLRSGVWANLQVRLANDQVSVSVNADAMSNDSRRTVALTARLPSVPPRGFVGLFLSNGSGFSDDFTVRRLPVVGACGDGVCDARADEDCINCATDCVAPCGCGDGVCWGDDEVVDGCFDCRPVVVSNRDASRHWAPRADNVAAFFSFDNATILGADVSGNGLDLNSTAVASSTTESCARGSCAKLNGADQGLALAVVSSAYGRLPVGVSPITIILFLRFDPPLAESRRKSAPLLQFGSADDGTQSLVTLWRNDTHGRLRWLHGSMVLDIEVDWAAPGARHMAFSFADGALLIRVDNQVFNAASCARNGIVPVMTTFGRLTIGGGGFVGTVDELVILAENVSDAMFQRHGTDANWTVARAPVRQTSDGDAPAPAPQAPRVFEDCNNFRACDECALKNDCVWCDVSGCVPVGVNCSGSVFLTCGGSATEVLLTTNGTSSHPNVTRVSDERDQYNLITSVGVLVGTALSLYIATAALLLFLHFRHKRLGPNIKYDKLSGAADSAAEGGGDVDDDTVTNLN